jgi:hypothetical protein
VVNGISAIDMENNDSNYDMSSSCEGSEELNGKDASYRNAPMISSPRTILKRRIRGALVPMRNPNETLG